MEACEDEGVICGDENELSETGEQEGNEVRQGLFESKLPFGGLDVAPTNELTIAGSMAEDLVGRNGGADDGAD